MKDLKQQVEEDFVKEMLTHFVRFKGECEHDENEDKERFLNTPLVKSAIKQYTDGILALFNSNLKEEREKLIKGISDKNFLFMEECEPDCDEVRHARHEGSWQHYWKLDRWLNKLATNTLEVKV
jgi:hypothetical protein